MTPVAGKPFHSAKKSHNHFTTVHTQASTHKKEHSIALNDALNVQINPSDLGMNSVQDGRDKHVKTAFSNVRISRN